MNGDRPAEKKGKKDIWGAVGSFTQRRANPIIVLTVTVTVLLIIPIVFMSPDKRAKDDSGGPAFDLKERIEEQMPPADLYTSFIVEARDGDILTQKELRELYGNEERLRGSELGREYLVNRFDPETSRWVVGIYTIADAVQQLLNETFGFGLDEATDDHVKVAVHHLFLDPESLEFKNWLSVRAYNETRTVLGQEITCWVSPGLLTSTISDNNKVLSGYKETLEGNHEDEVVKEYYNRDLQEFLRGDQEMYELWGIAIDVNMEAEDEGTLSFPLILAAVILILIIVAVMFRSFVVMGLTLAGLIMVIIWLKGLSNLLGLNSSLTLDILVPVSILVLGVDYMIHSLHRYEEEREKVKDPKRALGLGIGGVGGALFLAMLTTVIAFGSNAISNIESIVGFGIASSVAIISAFIIMGFFLPAAKMKIDSRWRKGRSPDKEKGGKDGGSGFLSRAVLALADRRMVLLPIIVVISMGAAYFALQLEAKLDAKEYFDPSSDFVVSLDKLDEHVGEKAGEPILFYIEGDLTDPDALRAVGDFEESMSDNENIARDPLTGEVNIYIDIFDLFNKVFKYNYTRGAVEKAAGVNITDDDLDGVPDTREQLRAVLRYMYRYGLPMNDTTMLYGPEHIHEILFVDMEEEGEYATVVMTGIPDTRELETVRDSEEEFREDMTALNVESISFYGLTGPGIQRERTLTAITESLTWSILAAVVLCLIVLIVMFRSFKYAFVTVIPEVLVAAWLYAVMFIAGYHLNAVTATIAAISIGVGIDYSVHITARFRQEMSKGNGKREAMERTAKHSGAALMGSAASTMFGFAIIGFAPMPMFSSFGILTAVMILMALVAALVVLPSLLLLVAGGRK